MQLQKENPWPDSTSPSKEVDLSFEDSFVDKPNTAQEKKYEPLDDSAEYLASLEKRLDKIKGKNSTNERKDLIKSLKQLKDDTVDRILRSDDITEEVYEHITSSINPESALGNVMRILAPDKVALSNEELCELLKADLMDQAFEEANK